MIYKKKASEKNLVNFFQKFCYYSIFFKSLRDLFYFLFLILNFIPIGSNVLVIYIYNRNQTKRRSPINYRLVLFIHTKIPNHRQSTAIKFQIDHDWGWRTFYTIRKKANESHVHEATPDAIPGLKKLIEFDKQRVAYYTQKAHDQWLVSFIQLNKTIYF